VTDTVTSVPSAGITGRFASRVVGALRLSRHAYEDVATDGMSLPQGALVLIAAAVASGAGAIGLSTETLNGGPGTVFVSGMFSALFAWLLWTVSTMVAAGILDRGVPEKRIWGRMFRASLFAQAPVVFWVVGFVPVIDKYAILVILAWQVAAMTVAVRQAFGGMSYGWALAPAVIGYVPVALVNFFIIG